MKHLNDRPDRLTPGKTMPKLATYQRRLTDLENWLTANSPALGAFARGAGCRLPDAAHVLRCMVSSSRNAECDLTLTQLVSKTLLTDAQVKRALKALHDAGCWVQVLPGCSAGRRGGAGRGAVRRLTMLGAELQGPQDDLVRRVVRCLMLTMLGTEPQAPAEPAPWQEMMVQSDAPAAEMMVQSEPNDGAPECAPLRGYPYGNPPADAVHNADAAPAQQGGEDQHNELTEDPALAPVVTLAGRCRTLRKPTPDRRAFPSTAAWCEAMAQHVATELQADQHAGPEPAHVSAQSTTQQQQHPMPAPQRLKALAAAAGRRYAQTEFVAGRCDSLEGLTNWSADQHLKSLTALCQTNDNWRRWVHHAGAETVSTALHNWHQDRTLHQSLVAQLDAEAQRAGTSSRTG